MISKVLTKSRKSLIKACQAMSPEERLVAFFNLSRLTHLFYLAGKRQLKRPQISKPSSQKHRLIR
jgi:hypothetical protein